MKDDLLYDKYISLILERDELEKEAEEGSEQENGDGDNREEKAESAT